MGGSLQITTKSQSLLAQTALPYVLRDSRLAVVQRGTVGGEPIGVPEGLYSLDVVTPGGTPTSMVVNVSSDATTHVVVADEKVDQPALSAPPATDEAGSETIYVTPRWRARGATHKLSSDLTGSLALIRYRTMAAEPVALPHGRYSLDIVNRSSAPTSVPIDVFPNMTTHVVVGDALVDPRKSNVPLRMGAGNAAGIIVTPRWSVGDEPYTQWLETLDVEGILNIPLAEGVPEFHIAETRQCEVSQWVNAETVEIAPAKRLTRMPTATVVMGERRFEMSLPLNPLRYGPMARCLLSRVHENGSYRLRAGFAPARDTSVLVAGLVRSNAANSAIDLLRKATDLLSNRHADPTGAILGALTLHRVNELGQRQQLVERIARDFEWLPDGQILCAATLMKSTDKAEATRGLTMLLSATRKRPLFTDGLSLALELLRRWPGEESQTDRLERLDQLANLSAYADWDSINLSTEIVDSE